MTNLWTAKLPWPQPILSPNARGHWAPKHKAFQAYKNACGWALIGAGIRRISAPDLKIHITFYRPTKARHDKDNLIGRFKAGQDAIATQTGIDDAYFDVSHEIATETGGYVIARIEAPLVNLEHRGMVE